MVLGFGSQNSCFFLVPSAINPVPTLDPKLFKDPRALGTALKIHT